MEYFEFENIIRRKLERETKDFDVNQMLEDLNIRKKRNRSGFWLFPFGSLVLFSLFAFNYWDVGSFKDSSDTEQQQEVVDMSKTALAKLPTDKQTQTAELFELNLSDKQTADNQKDVDLLTEENSDAPSLQSKIANSSIPVKSKASLSVKEVLSNDIFPVFSSVSKNNKNQIDNYNQPKFSLISALADIKQKQFLPFISVPTFITDANYNVDCPDFASADKSAGFEIVAEFGVFKPIKSLRNLSMETNQLLALRQDNEKPLIGIQGGVYLKYNLNRSPFYIFGGANYSKITEKMNLDFVTTEIDTTIGVVSVTASELGDTITYIYGELYTETTTTGNKVRHYSISNIDLPIHLGYELDLNRFSIGAEVGLALNVAVISDGNLLSSQTDFSNLDEESKFKNRVGLRYDGRLFAAYKIDQRQKLYLSANFNAYPSSFSTEDQGVEHLYRSVGVNFGYGFLF